jgi:hypothetical protein
MTLTWSSDLENLDAWLSTPPAVLSTGAPRVGKTRLALRTLALDDLAPLARAFSRDIARAPATRPRATAGRRRRTRGPAERAW